MIYLVLASAVLLQSTLFSIPFVIPILLFYFILTKNPSVFFIAAVFGLLIDTLLLNPIGSTSLFLIIFLFVSTLYTRIFEMETFYFAAIFTLAGSAVYSYIFYPSNFVLKAAVCFFIAFAIYYGRAILSNPKLNKESPRLLK